jgi:poly-beta-1,6-N-acetyl-D-glucosamine synthase
MNIALTMLLWSSIALIVYVFVGYPLALAARAALRPHPWRREPSHATISIVMAAYNEAACLAPKIMNLLSLDYPADRVEILVGSDGSTDSTVDQLVALHEPRVRNFIFAERRGKPAVLNTLVAEARGEIVVFADVRQEFDSQVLRALTQSFADPEVGAATGELILRRSVGGSAATEGSGFYWRYEKFIRARECIVNSTIVVTGAIYAIRRALYEPIPADTIGDDLLIPLRVARRGYRVVVERDARAYDIPSATSKQEFRRKVRTVGGAFQIFSREPWLFNPMQNRLWWQTMSHKALRLIVAPLQVTAFAANALLASQSEFYQWMLFAQMMFYACAIVACAFPRGHKRPVVLTLPYIFCLLSWTTVLAFLRWITHRQSVKWEKAPSTFAASSAAH